MAPDRDAAPAGAAGDELDDAEATADRGDSGNAGTDTDAGDDSDAAPDSPAAPTRARLAADQQARAEETLRRIFAGGDLGAETLALSNRFTDETAARWMRRLRRSDRTPPTAS